MTNPCLLGEKDPRGRTVIWEVTRTCQLNCPHCCSNSGQRYLEEGYQDLNIQQALGILDILYRNGVSVLYLSGGEPLLWEPLPQFARQVRGLGMDCCIATSGYVCDSNIEEICKQDVTAFHVSLDSWRADEHDAFRGVAGAFNRSLGFILYAKEKNFTVVTSTMIRKDLLAHLDEFFEVASHCRIDRTVLNFFVPTGRAATFNVDVYSEVEKQSIAELVVKTAKRHGVIPTINRVYSRGLGLDKCPAGRQFAFINSYGKVSPCSWVAKLWPETLSDISDEIVPPEALASLDARMLSITDPYCSDCSEVKSCGRGCPVLAQLGERHFDALCNIEGHLRESR